MKIEDIIAIRMDNGIKQYEFAQLLGIPIGTWSNIETNRQPFYKDVKIKAIRILREMGCDFSVLNNPKRKEYLLENKRKILTLKEVKEVEEKGETPIIDDAFQATYMHVGSNEETKDIFQLVADQIAETLRKKNHDYGDSFHQLYEEFGDLSVYIRLKDKMGRLKTLIQHDAMIVEESLDDAFLDIAGYALLRQISQIKREEKGEDA